MCAKTVSGYYNYEVEWYPTDRRGESCHDLHVEMKEGTPDVGVEVVTDGNNTDCLVSKWNRLQNEDRVTFWIFDRRETACRYWNKLDSRGEFSLDNQCRKPGGLERKGYQPKDLAVFKILSPRTSQWHCSKGLPITPQSTQQDGALRRICAFLDARFGPSRGS